MCDVRCDICESDGWKWYLPMTVEEQTSAADKAATAMQAIQESIEQEILLRRSGMSGVIRCPVCHRGGLRFSVARGSRQCHAACSVTSCVRFMATIK